MSHRVHLTARGVEVVVLPGRKSANDFIVKYVEPRKRPRTPQHVHLIVEIYVKQAHDPTMTLALRDHLLEVYGQTAPISGFPPALQVFRPDHVDPFKGLDAVGEFSVEFLLVVSELMAARRRYQEVLAREIEVTMREGVRPDQRTADLPRRLAADSLVPHPDGRAATPCTPAMSGAIQAFRRALQECRLAAERFLSFCQRPLPLNPWSEKNRLLFRPEDRLLQRFEAVLADPELLDLRRDVATIEVLIDEELDRLRAGATAEQWERGRASYAGLRVAINARDTAVREGEAAPAVPVGMMGRPHL